MGDCYFVLLCKGETERVLKYIVVEVKSSVWFGYVISTYKPITTTTAVATPITTTATITTTTTILYLLSLPPLQLLFSPFLCLPYIQLWFYSPSSSYSSFLPLVILNLNTLNLILSIPTPSFHSLSTYLLPSKLPPPFLSSLSRNHSSFPSIFHCCCRDPFVIVVAVCG